VAVKLNTNLELLVDTFQSVIGGHEAPDFVPFQLNLLLQVLDFACMSLLARDILCLQFSLRRVLAGFIMCEDMAYLEFLHGLAAIMVRFFVMDGFL
jgi:hypothetical protein